MSDRLIKDAVEKILFGVNDINNNLPARLENIQSKLDDIASSVEAMRHQLDRIERKK